MKSVTNLGSFVVMIVLARLWIEIDQDLLPQNLLMPGFLAVITILLFAYFIIVKPNNVKRFALYLSLAVCIIAILLTLLQHFILVNDFSLVWKNSLMIWSFTLILPNLIGFGYSKIIKRS